MPPPKKKAKSKAKSPTKKALTVTVSGHQASCFVGVLKKTELKKLQGSGLTVGCGLLSLSDVILGTQEITWLNPDSIVATASGKKISIHKKTNDAECVERYYYNKNVVYVENTTRHAQYTAEVFANSVEDIRVEVVLTEEWTLPDGQLVEIHSVRVTRPVDVELEYQDGRGGNISGELITADGESIDLNEEEDEDSGEYRVKVSAS